jgi:hypothetical protein
MHVCISIYTEESLCRMHVCIHQYACMKQAYAADVWLHTYILPYVFMYVCMYVCMHVCMNVRMWACRIEMCTI